MAIFITAFLMLLGIFPTGLRSVKQARELTMATHLAQQSLENTAAAPFVSIQSSPPAQVPVAITTNGAESSVNYVVQTLVTEVPAGAPEYKNVMVQVSWDDGTRVRAVTLETDVLP